MSDVLSHAVGRGAGLRLLVACSSRLGVLLVFEWSGFSFNLLISGHFPIHRNQECARVRKVAQSLPCEARPVDSLQIAWFGSRLGSTGWIEDRHDRLRCVGILAPRLSIGLPVDISLDLRWFIWHGCCSDSSCGGGKRQKPTGQSCATCKEAESALWGPKPNLQAFSEQDRDSSRPAQFLMTVCAPLASGTPAFFCYTGREQAETAQPAPF